CLQRVGQGPGCGVQAGVTQELLFRHGRQRLSLTDLLLQGCHHVGGGLTAATANHRRVLLLRIGRLVVLVVTTRATRVRDRRRSRWRPRRTAAAARMETTVSAIPAAAARITGPRRSVLMCRLLELGGDLG